MKKNILVLTLFFFTFRVHSFDCSNIAPFESKGTLIVNVTIESNRWSNGEVKYETICKKVLQIPWFDVRGREEAAYYCLRSKVSEIVSCPTTLENDTATIFVLPASWVREWTGSPVREYRFHAIAQKNNDPDYYLDIFSRTLNENLHLQTTTIEGSLAQGSKVPTDGFWIRVEFSKKSE